MDDELKLSGFRKWHDAELQQGGGVRNVTRIRYFLGTHGPFERTFDRDVKDEAIQQAIREEKRSLETIARL